jgi:precorrin-6B methylase 2
LWRWSFLSFRCEGPEDPGGQQALGRAYEPMTTLAFHTLVQPGDRVVDVGAHVGYFTLLAARLCGPNGRVFAFEPHPDNFRLLERNIRENGAENVTAVRKAVADRAG